jgi:putative endonuclease
VQEVVSSNLTGPTILISVIKVYVLRSIANRQRYVGMTADLRRRLTEHRRPTSSVGRLLGPFDVIHEEEHPDYTASRVREKYLKSGKGRAWLNQQYGK